MTIDFSDRGSIGERTENKLKMGKIQNVTAGNLPIYPLTNQKSTQGNQKQKQKHDNQENNDQVRRHPLCDMIPMSYTHLLPILIHVEAIVPKETGPSRFPYRPRHDPNATCEHHAGYIGHST